MLAVLYFHVLRIRPDEPAWPDRDRFVLSKGHSSIGLYAAMALRGYFPVEELADLRRGALAPPGPPGHDPPARARHVHRLARHGDLRRRWAWRSGARLTGRDIRAYVMLGDGECQEGEVWEAAMAAARYGLDNLIAIVDHNKLQQYGWPGDGPDGRIPPAGPRRARRQVDRLRLARARGRRPRHGRRSCACSTRRPRGDGRPVVVIAHTVKGKGVSFMEGHYFWHTRAIKPEEFAIAMADLGEPLPDAEGAPR